MERIVKPTKRGEPWKYYLVTWDKLKTEKWHMDKMKLFDPDDRLQDFNEASRINRSTKKTATEEELNSPRDGCIRDGNTNQLRLASPRPRTRRK